MKATEDDFYAWWGEAKDGYPATPLMKRCFYAGFEYAVHRMARLVAMVVTVAVIAVVFFAATGCTDRYRYPCQDPKNWEQEECKRPLCAATQSCPDQLTKPEEMKGDVR